MRCRSGDHRPVLFDGRWLDPHGDPRAAAAEQQLVSDFFGGAVQQSDHCGGPCYAGGFTSP